MTLGTRIAELRKQAGYSQEYLAQALNISRQAVSKWEQDQTSPDTGNLIALASLLGVSVEYLATGKKPEPSAVHSVPDPDKNALTVQKILGIMLIGFGLFSAILGVLFSYLLILVGGFLLLVGVLFLAFQSTTARRHKIYSTTALWLALSMLLLIAIGLACSITTGLSIRILVCIVSGSIAVPMMAWGGFRFVRFLLRKHKSESDLEPRN